ncbi:ferredoxin--NADP+ reductase [Kitasatospora sp. SolWspMP-SS2h]|nr:ferredoxin--NADP+ reductase [Kitasatospora sp. SolWspMP-SS2h]
MPRPVRVAIVGAGPAGICAADAPVKSDLAGDPGVSVDLFERMPAPFGLIRYGAAPDHPRTKDIVTALQQVLDKPQVRLFGDVDHPGGIGLDDLHRFYDAVIFSTGANADRDLDVPGIGLDSSYGAADFASWYDGHRTSRATGRWRRSGSRCRASPWTSRGSSPRPATSC